MSGITHVPVNTMGLGLERPDDHVETLRRFEEEAGFAAPAEAPRS